MAATMKEVALRAGVSIRTVSRAINGLEGISNDTRRKVLSVADELGYRPSLLARALVTRRSRSLGLAIPHITNPYFAEVAQGAFETAREKGYTVLLNCFDTRTARDRKDWFTLVDSAVDGMITNLAYGQESSLYQLADRFNPIVLLMKDIARPGISSVNVDIQSGAETAVDYLVSQGHRHIALIIIRIANPRLIERYVGYCQVVKKHGLTPNVQYLSPDWREPDVQEGYRAALQLFDAHPEVTAIFTYNDLIAIGALQACKETGRRVPQDCAVIGFDDIPFATHLTPALTTVRVDKYALGQQSVLRLLEMIEAPGQVFPPRRLDAELILRESA